MHGVISFSQFRPPHLDESGAQRPGRINPMLPAEQSLAVKAGSLQSMTGIKVFNGSF
jgi:hypothetical protein